MVSEAPSVSFPQLSARGGEATLWAVPIFGEFDFRMWNPGKRPARRSLLIDVL